MSQPLTLLVDNGSLEPAASLALRESGTWSDTSTRSVVFLLFWIVSRYS